MESELCLEDCGVPAALRNTGWSKLSAARPLLTPTASEVTSTLRANQQRESKLVHRIRALSGENKRLANENAALKSAVECFAGLATRDRDNSSTTHLEGQSQPSSRSPQEQPYRQVSTDALHGPGSGVVLSDPMQPSAAAAAPTAEYFIAAYNDLLQHLRVALEESHEDVAGAGMLEACISSQRACLARLTAAGSAPFGDIMAAIRSGHQQWSSHAITRQHATALAAAELSAWQKDVLRQAAAVHFQTIDKIAAERKAAATTLQQDLNGGPPPLGQGARSHILLRWVQQRLKQTQLAEGCSFWELSNQFFMRETLSARQSAKLQSFMAPMMVDCAIAGRLLLAETPGQYAHLALPMPAPTPLPREIMVDFPPAPSPEADALSGGTRPLPQQRQADLSFLQQLVGQTQVQPSSTAANSAAEATALSWQIDNMPGLQAVGMQLVARTSNSDDTPASCIQALLPQGHRRPQAETEAAKHREMPALPDSSKTSTPQDGAVLCSCDLPATTQDGRQVQAEQASSQSTSHSKDLLEHYYPMLAF